MSFSDILNRDTSEFNEKTINASLAHKRLKHSELYRRLPELTFLPVEYKSFLEEYLKCPDIFIMFPTFNACMAKYMSNVFQDPQPYELMYRVVPYKEVIHRISLMWLGHYSIVVGSRVYEMSNSFVDVFGKFMTNNYIRN